MGIPYVYGGSREAVKLYDLAISPQVAGGKNYVVAAGYSTAGPGLYYYTLGTITTWYDAVVDFNTPLAAGDIDAFRAVLSEGVPLAACVTNLERLMHEYERTERRVRALENVILPEIHSDLAMMEGPGGIQGAGDLQAQALRNFGKRLYSKRNSRYAFQPFINSSTSK